MTDYFLTFGIDRTFSVERGPLERRFHELQSRSHPDRHVTASPEAREEALAQSSAINSAYRTLREPLSRAKHLLELYGYPMSGQKKVPQSLLMIVMDVQERIAEIETVTDRQSKQRLTHELSTVTEELEGRRTVIDEERARLLHEWDGSPRPTLRDALSAPEQELLGRMAQLISERAYLETLHWSVQAAREGRPAFIQH